MNKVGLIGLGAIGAPIAHKLFKYDSMNFVLVADEMRKNIYKNRTIHINADPFSPIIVSEREEIEGNLNLLIICVKNYQLETAINTIKKVINDETILLPLENGIAAFNVLRKEFPKNIILEGYAQGPNTVRVGNDFIYQNSGTIHMGSSKVVLTDIAIQVYLWLKGCNVEVVYEPEIKKMIWKKWMLNAAGNTVTALVGASYSDFKRSKALQQICTDIMKEFRLIALCENIYLDDDDIRDVVDYYVGYNGEKRTSMLEDIENKCQTENEYITGEIIKLAKKYDVEVPINNTMYLLIKGKEDLYLSE